MQDENPWIEAMLCHSASLRFGACPACIGRLSRSRNHEPNGPDPRASVPAQVHMTQGATPADMYISWATGNAVYTYCSESDGATCGDDDERLRVQPDRADHDLQPGTAQIG